MENYEQMLDKVLAEKYPEESIEMGENWELIAKIFYDIGFDDGKKSS